MKSLYVLYAQLLKNWPIKCVFSCDDLFKKMNVPIINNVGFKTSCRPSRNSSGNLSRGQESLEEDSYQNWEWLMVWVRQLSQGGIRRRSTSPFWLFSALRCHVSPSAYHKWIFKTHNTGEHTSPLGRFQFVSVNLQMKCLAVQLTFSLSTLTLLPLFDLNYWPNSHIK